MTPLSSAEGPPGEGSPGGGATTVTEEAPGDPSDASRSDDLRAGLLAAFEADLGDAMVGSHVVPGQDLWVRVATDAWTQAGELARDRLGCAYFCFLSAIDWLPSPFGRYEDAEVDTPLAQRAAERADPVQGFAGGDTRLQVFARVHSPAKGYGITLKADVDDQDPAIESWVRVYAGADWHEREAWEMYGIDFIGHPGLRNLYLPGDFEGHPLRKDFPLLARVVKPWPGIVDVEPMPDEEAEATVEPAGSEEPVTTAPADTPAPSGEASVEPRSQPVEALVPEEPATTAPTTAGDEAPTAVEAPVDTHGESASAEQLAEGAAAVDAADATPEDEVSGGATSPTDEIVDETGGATVVEPAPEPGAETVVETFDQRDEDGSGAAP